jgi:hypothetical protein
VGNFHNLITDVTQIRGERLYSYLVEEAKWQTFEGKVIYLQTLQFLEFYIYLIS